MRGARALLLLLLLLGSPGQTRGENGLVKWVVRAEPESVEIYLQSSSNQGLEEYLGRSEEPIFLSLDRFRDRSSLRIVLRAPGYIDKSEAVPLYLLRKGYFPEQGVVRLQPVHWWVPARDLLARQLPAAVVLSLAVVALGGFWLRQAARTRRKLRRAELLEGYHAGAVTRDPLLGSLLGSYRLLERLGKGGMGFVYRAVPDAELGSSDSMVAIKVMDPERLKDPESRLRFMRESRLCLELSHPNIVRVWDYGEEEGIYFLVMEWVDGVTLRKRMGQFSERQACGCILQMMDALEHAHSQGVVHRDLKPENVMITARDQVKIMDFGLALRQGEGGNLTRTGEILGTPGYISPEQASAKKDVGPPADQYAVGVMAFEMLAGRTPFQHEDPFQLVFKHLTEKAPRLNTVRPDLGEELDCVLARMLEKDPRWRYSSMEAASAAFRQATSHLPEGNP
ncbi:MAG: serine/threonine protein kinase [Armatimonadetes bacterium]|nr:serine/threonine protein kinase [Armatimonadota bacterium]